jgi:hypothetical protein
VIFPGEIAAFGIVCQLLAKKGLEKLLSTVFTRFPKGFESPRPIRLCWQEVPGLNRLDLEIEIGRRYLGGSRQRLWRRITAFERFPERRVNGVIPALFGLEHRRIMQQEARRTLDPDALLLQSCLDL